MKLNIREAFNQASEQGKPVMKKTLAEKLWPESKPVTQQVNMTNLMNGSTKRITVEMVNIICTELNCTPNYLFNEKE